MPDVWPTFPPAPGRIVDVDTAESLTWRQWIGRNIRGGLRRRSVFLLAFWGVTVGYLLFNLIVVLHLIWPW